MKKWREVFKDVRANIFQSIEFLKIVYGRKKHSVTETVKFVKCTVSCGISKEIKLHFVVYVKLRLVTEQITTEKRMYTKETLVLSSTLIVLLLIQTLSTSGKQRLTCLIERNKSLKVKSVVLRAIAICRE